MPDPLQLTPIGFVRTGLRNKFDAPHQPDSGGEERCWIELLPDQNFEIAMQDLAGFERIWVISWFDRNANWRPRVMPPRGPAVRRGVFATRSPHRPNPIGLTSVRLYAVEGLILETGPLDLTDGTPVLDIKPYLHTVDAHPEAKLGWLEEVELAENAPGKYEVVIEEPAQEQLDWLRTNFGIDYISRASVLLSRDPSPHRTRRILKLQDNEFRMACGAWRIFFQMDGNLVKVQRIGKGYSDESLVAPGFEKIVDRDAQIAFAHRYRSPDARQT
jgi:tRNA-Thr(GGU) m(6)t(6)A37 methyltransferase TsaA